MGRDERILKRRTGLKRGPSLKRARSPMRKSGPMARRKSRQRGHEAEALTARVYTKASGEQASFQPGSGNRWHSKGDLISKTHLIEVKSFLHPPLIVRRKTLEKIAKQAARAGRIPLLSVVCGERAWAVVDASQAPEPPVLLKAGKEQISLRPYDLDLRLFSLEEAGQPPFIGIVFEGSHRRYAVTHFDAYVEFLRRS